MAKVEKKILNDTYLALANNCTHSILFFAPWLHNTLRAALAAKGARALGAAIIEDAHL